MNLRTFLEQRGDDAVARALRVKPRTVKSWRLGDRSPRPPQAIALAKLSRGDLSLLDIYSDRA